MKTERSFRLKNPKREFFCALCTKPRQMKYLQKLSTFQYLQIMVLFCTLSILFYPLTGVRGIFFAAFIWPIYEIIHKMLYRRELPCPHCGFDPTWYRRDVKMARKKIKQFWENEQKIHNPPSIKKADTREEKEQIEDQLSDQLASKEVESFEQHP